MIIRNAMSSLCPEILWEPQGEKKGQTSPIPTGLPELAQLSLFDLSKFTRDHQKTMYLIAI